MPTYQYVCKECDHQFEVVQSMSESSLTDCPQCQGRLRKLFNAVGVIFKGSGFYRTDSRAETQSSNTSDSSGNADTSTKSTESTGNSGSGSGATASTESSTGSSESSTSSSSGGSSDSGSTAKATS